MKEIKAYLEGRANQMTQQAEVSERNVASYSAEVAKEIEIASRHRKLAAEYSRLAAEQPE